jgi:hypothetical protein
VFAHRFKGQVFLITDARNGSTTFTMAAIFRQSHGGMIVGEPTGGTGPGINGGQFLFLHLPYSKIEIDLPLIWGAYHHDQPDEGIIPDVIIRQTQESIYKQVDAALAYILSRKE